MTTSLEDYLRDQYLRDKQQLKRVLEVIEQIAPIFVKYQTQFTDSTGSIRTWPYKIVNGTFEPVQRVSDSTQSMILFVLDAILQATSESTLGPQARPVLCPRKLRGQRLNTKDLSQVVREAKLETIKRLLQKAEPLVTSSTFGDDDPFTLTWLAELLLRCRPTSDDVPSTDLDRLKTRVREAATKVCRRPANSQLAFVKREPGTPHHEEMAHCFQMLRSVHLAKVTGQLGAPIVLMLTLDNINVQTFLDHLHKQLGYYSIPDSRFDPAVLVFAMEGALQLDPHSLSDSTIESVFRTLEAFQQGNSYWRPITPFLSDSRGMVLFPVSVEISNSLLRSFELLHDAHRPAYSAQLEPLLRRYVQWLLARAERVTFDSEQFIGWHSEHVNLPGTVHLWQTSQVLFFLVHYCSLLQRKIASDGLTLAGLTVREWGPIKEVRDYWKSEPLDVLSRLGDADPSGLSETADRRYAALSAIEGDFINTRRSRSLMLYGPPGTGKTTVAEQLARSLQQPLVVITVSDFLAGAADEVEARAKGIFQVLEEQEDVVILFDEIDQFLLDRNGTRYGNQSGIFQFLTPGMLTKFQNLKDLGRSIFIVATNYEERIDSAIKRQGRFDHRILLCLPDKERRRDFLWTFLCSKLEQLRANDNSMKALQAGATSTDAVEFVNAIKTPDLVNNSAAKTRFSSSAQDLLKDTALFGWGDLRHLVNTELQITPGDSWKTIGDKLRTVRSNVQPSIRIGAYESRFKKIEDPQTPSEEFVLLLYLLGESDTALSADDLKWINRQGVSALIEQLPTSDKVKRFLRRHLPSTVQLAAGPVADQKNTGSNNG